MSLWGRIIGGTAGFAIGGPIGAILGVMAGSVFDKKNKIKFDFNSMSNQQKQNCFILLRSLTHAPSGWLEPFPRTSHFGCGEKCIKKCIL